jgi:proteasome assembly chaperone (PAC2) family protein
MDQECLSSVDVPKLTDATMLLALTGWMDGGAVSTGTVRNMMQGRNLIEIARIAPDPFYIYNFPGSMEITSLFRPEVYMKGGVIRDLDMPSNIFSCDVAANLVFFIGKEPNLRWEQFAECIFQVARQAGVRRIIFIGSFGGTVPHTREPRMFGSVSHKSLRPILKASGVRPSDYRGPASLSTYLLAKSPANDLEMISFVSEIPGYLDGVNPLSIEAVSRRLSRILNVPVNLDAMREASNKWEVQVTEAVQQDEELAATVKKLEEAYDTELVEDQSG